MSGGPFYPPVVKKRPAGGRTDVAYACPMVRTGNYRCGACLRGNLGPHPELGRKCRICGAEVVR